MIKDVVVNLGLGAKDPAGDFAVAVGEAFEAHVAGIAVAYEPIIPGAVMGGIPPEFIEAQRTESEKKAKDATARFEAAAKRSSLSAETRTLTSSVSGAADQFARIARRFDLVVVGQPDPNEGIQDEVIDEAALFESGRPVVYVPFIHKGGLKLDRVMVCWDGGRAATRAIADSMPLLKKAGQVDIVMVASKREDNKEIPGIDLGQHLARHGLKVEVKRLTSPDIDINSTLLSYAADSNADLIVMGGYGHSRLRDFVLGGATQGVLDEPKMPVLISH